MQWQDLRPDSSGKLRIAVVGEGDDFDLLPKAFSLALREMGIDCDVVAISPTAEEFKEAVPYLSECGFKGVSVCNPLKAEAAKLAKDYFTVRHGLGVANALTLGGPNVYAQNTEVAAFNHAISGLTPATALVLGSGRAARSAVQSLFESGWKVRLWNRNVIRSKPFVALFEYYGKVETVSQADPTGCNLIVNATPLGIKAGEQPPVIWTHAKPRSAAIDFVYRSVATEFLRSAAQRGFKTYDGRELLVEQAALALEWWTGKTVPREPMLHAVGFRKI
jgi:shikimate dehydrogenase